MSAEATSLVGRVLDGKYEVLSLLGEGGMGVVYKVRHLVLRREKLFALKILHPRLSEEPRFRQRFLREVEAAMELAHENVVQVRDFGVTEDDLLFFTMDYCSGRSLKEAIRESGPFAPDRARRLAVQLARALAEAHRVGVVHRDLKPDNILVEHHAGDERVKILDFGIAKLVEDEPDDEQGLTRGTVIGTPKYMSPEQASGEEVDGRSDLYSLGIVLYEMLTGRVPFAGKTARSIVLAHLHTPPPPLAEALPGVKVPESLERVVLSLLEKSPDDRPAGAEECWKALEGTAELPAGLGARGATEVLRVDAGRARGSRRWGAVAALALAVGAAAVAGVVWWGLGSRSLSGPVAHAIGSEDAMSAPDGATDRAAGAPTSFGAEGRGGLGESPLEAVFASPPDGEVAAGSTTRRCAVCGEMRAPSERPSGLCCWVPLGLGGGQSDEEASSERSSRP